MLIVCPSCASEYALDPDRIGEEGRKVRCAICRTTWFVRRAEPDAGDPAPDAGTGEVAGLRMIEGSVAPAQPRMPPPAVRPGRQGRPKPDRAREPLALAAIALVLLAAPVAVALRHGLVRALPETAPIFAALGLGVNVVGLELGEVTAGIAEDGRTRALVIEGDIRSVASAPVRVPRLEFAIQGQDGTGLYRWSLKPPVLELAPGESARFTTRLTSPPPDGARLVASFQSDAGDRSVALR